MLLMYCAFGIRVVNQIIKEENLKLDPKAIQAMFEEADRAEQSYADYILKDPILGYSAEEHKAQFTFIANRKAKQLKLTAPFPNTKNTLPWLDQQANMRKEKNFFETRVTEHQTGSALAW